MSEPWDWPPPRRHARVEIIPPSSGTYRVRPRQAGKPDLFWRILGSIFKVMIAIPLALVALGSIWMLSAILKL